MTDSETLRRVRAAIAYADREQHEIAASLDIAPRTLERWKAEGVPRQRINLPLIAAECGLPAAFFQADFSRLAEIPTEPAVARAEKQPPLPGTQDDVEAQRGSRASSQSR
jgi:hypothetical protein